MYEAVRYVSLNPVRAGLVERAQDWRWSSVNAHLKGQDDRAFKTRPVLERFGNFSKYLAEPFDEIEAFKALRLGETTGRPAGEKEWIMGLEKTMEKQMLPQKRGRKKGKSKLSR